MILLSVAILVGLAVEIDAHFKQISNAIVPDTDWIRFDIPHNARVIKVSTKRMNDGLHLCIEGRDWSNTKVRLTGKYGASYLAAINSQSSCVVLKPSDFAEPSWKRMPMPSNEVIQRVEVLADGHPPGYWSETLP
jgi:hypothetical protein